MNKNFREPDLDHEAAKREALRNKTEAPHLVQPNLTTLNLSLCYLNLLEKFSLFEKAFKDLL